MITSESTIRLQAAEEEHKFNGFTVYYYYCIIACFYIRGCIMIRLDSSIKKGPHKRHLENYLLLNDAQQEIVCLDG